MNDETKPVVPIPSVPLLIITLVDEKQVVVNGNLPQNPAEALRMLQGACDALAQFYDSIYKNNKIVLANTLPFGNAH